MTLVNQRDDKVTSLRGFVNICHACDQHPNKISPKSRVIKRK